MSFHAHVAPVAMPTPSMANVTAARSQRTRWTLQLRLAGSTVRVPRCSERREGLTAVSAPGGRRRDSDRMGRRLPGGRRGSTACAGIERTCGRRELGLAVRPLPRRCPAHPSRVAQSGASAEDGRLVAVHACDRARRIPDDAANAARYQAPRGEAGGDHKQRRCYPAARRAKRCR